MNSLVLVTGGTGFLGSYIIKELVEKSYRVRAIRRHAALPSWIPGEIFENVDWVDGDILDVVSLDDAMEGVDIVIHAAAIVSFIGKDKNKMYHVNVEGTANVVNTALEKNVKRLVYISSVAALGRSLGGGHVDEDKKWEETKANTHYARSKYKAELQVWRAMAEGLPAVILNPSTILGYGDWNHGSCAIFKNVYNEFTWYTSGINGFVDVEDTAKIVVLMAENDVTEQRFIVNGDTWSFKKLQDTIAEYFGKVKPKKKAGPFLLAIAWRLEKLKSIITGKNPLLTKESARVAKSQTWFENEKLLKFLPGFSFRPLDQCIKSACDRYASLPGNSGEKTPPIAE